MIQIRMRTVFFAIRFYAAKCMIDLVIFCYAIGLISQKKSPSINVKGASPQTLSLFIISSSKDFQLSLTAMLSAYYFLPQITITYLHDASLRAWQRWILQRLPLSIEVFDNYSNIDKQLSRYPTTRRFYNYSWSGKKFLVPLLHKKNDLVMLLDTDTIFLDSPTEIYTWLKKPRGAWYMQDYQNFQVVSPIEAREILGKKASLLNVNTGLLGFNVKDLKKKHSLSSVEGYLTRIFQTVKSRVLYDDFLNNDFHLYSHLLEQTLFWLLLESLSTTKLPRSYFLCNQQIGRNLQNVLPKKFVHFAGDPTRKSLYRYLFLSLKTFISDIIVGKKSVKPWYMRGNHAWQ